MTTTRTQHSWGGGKGGGDDDKRDVDDDDDNDADQLRPDSVVVSRGGERERERESLSVLSFLLAIHRQRERRGVVCLNRRLIYLLFICCVGVGVVVKATFRERHFLFFSFLFCVSFFCFLLLL